MTTRELLATLATRGVTLSVHGDALRVRAPQGALDAELQAELARHKPELIRLLGAAGGAAPASAIPVRRDGPLPLSSSQQRLWFLDRLRPDSRAYALVVAFELEGVLDVAALRASLDGLVGRHEILRTTFGDTDGVPWQRIGAPAPADFMLEDFAGLPAGEALAAARRRAAEWGERAFDLGAGPLFRAGLLRLAPDRGVLVLALHHIVYDGWSLGVLYDELAALYAAQLHRRAAELPPPAVQFADFAAWERGTLQGPAFAALLEHGRARLDGLAPLELPADRPRPARQGLNGRPLELSLPAALVEGLSALGRRQGATLYMTLLAGFTALLGRDSGASRVAVGAPVANRERTEFERLVGPCLNLLVLATDLSGAPTFLELLERVRATTVDALAHQALPFEKLVEALAPERDRSRHPLVQVAFALHGAERAPALEGLVVRPLELPRATTVFDLAVDLFEQAGGLRAVLTYDSDLFDAGTIRALGAAWRTLLEQALADPGRPVGELPLLTAEEHRQWLAGLDATAADYPEVGVQVLVERQAQRTPQAVAVECEGRRLDYAELDARANRIAQVLRERGVRRGVLVGVCLDRDADLLAALLGIMKAGGAYVPLDPGFPPERLAFMLADSCAPVLLTRGGLLGALETLPPAVVRLDADAARIDAASAVAPPDGAGPDDLAYVIYTSGSTGRPKGVCVTHRSVVNLLTSMAREPGLGAADVLTAVTTISFDIAGLELFLPLSVGARVVLAPREVAGDGRRLARLLDDSGTTIMQATPATWQLLLQSGWSDPSVRRLCGGEALPRPLAQRLLEGGAELWNVYGPTETTIWSAVARVEPGPGPVPIGRPIANTRLLVLDEQRQPLPAGVPGELYIGGDGVARGYLGRDELTAERFVPDPFRANGAARLYRTGDRVRQRADGTLEFLGRLDSQVKLRGFRIELGEIEAALGEQPQISEAVVLLREDRAGDPRLVAYVTARDREAGVALDELRAGLLARLPEYMVPAVFVVLDALPRTPNRKLDRRALPAPDGARRSSVALIPPRTALEREVAAIWAGLLGLDAVGLRDDFFALGGHSLLATQLVSRLRDRLGVEVPLAQVFETPTLEGLCPWIEAERAAGAPRAALSAPVPVPRGDALPLSFAQQRLWFLDQMGAGAAYAVPLALQWSGRLDRDALRFALTALVERHESLRTRFPVVDGRPRQVIAPPFELRLDISDLTLLDAPARERERARLAAEEAERPFDLAAGPLIRARLVVLGPAEHVLLLTLHHVICDGWSLGVLFHELAELYRAACAGRAPALPPLAVQYADFAVWQRQALAGDALAAQLLYWKRRLGADLATLELAADRRRPAVQSFAGACWRFRLEGELTGALESLARAEGVTLAMLLLGAFGALLARDSGQEDVAVGSPIANRTRSELEPLIGFFANSLVLRLDLSGDPAFRDLVRRVQRISLEAYAHQDLPFERLVDELQPERSLGHNPLFQVVFAMQDAVPAPAALPDVTLVPLPPVVTRTRTDLELHLRPVDGGLEGLLVYATDLFDESTVARLARRFESILAGAVADPACRLSRLPVLEDDERRRILRTWNETAMPFAQDACLHELIEQRAAEAPGSTALVHGRETLSYGELNERANRVAHALRAMGVLPDRLVGLCLERGTAMIVGLLGILKAGGAYLPLDPGYPRERLAFMLADSGADVLVTTAALAQRLPAHGAALLCLDRDAERIAAAPASNPERVATPSNLAYAIYTSGSTGTPKCALLEHRGLCSLSEAQRRLFAVGPHSRVLQFSSLSFDAATFEIVMALPKGATLVLGDRHALLPGPDLLAVLAGQRISIVTLTPTALAALPAAALPDLATITVAGEACPPELVARWAPGRRLFNLYGPTETTIWATAAELKAGEAVQIGRPVGNVELYLLDAQGEPVPIGVPGEIHIGGVGLARGYHGRPELTAERFIAHPFRAGGGARLYRTGDRGRWLPDGSVEFLGRLDSQVKLRGHRIELGEIEAALRAHPAVRESLAVLREDGPGNRRIVAYVVDDPGVVVAAGGDPASSLAAAHVAHWQSLYDETYAGATAGADPTFDVSGWNSSYTGQPIEPAQMREWVERTVEQVVALAPRRLLEIGCGSGLLLFRLAPRCESYVGTDFSAAAIEAVGSQLRLLGDAAGRVRLLQRTAHDLHGLPEGGFDTVLLNSVVQYFPGADYLLAVIEQALALVGETGRIVIGDVRSLPLLSAFHASVQLHRASDAAPLDALRRQAHALANLDQELVVHPAFFQALAERLPRIAGVEVRPKPGRYDNELSRFRYDVVLHVGAAPAVEPAAEPGRWLDWRAEGLSVERLRARLESERPERLGLAAIPDARVAADVAAFELLERWDASDGEPTAGALRRAAAARAAGAAAAHPEELAELARELGYECRASRLAGRADGSFDLSLRRTDATLAPLAFPPAARACVSWAACTNDPLRGRRLRALVPALRSHLAERLPEPMLPAAIVVLEAFPITANGKLDRRALPAPDALRPELASDYVAPQSAVEATLARIWAEVLELQRVGVRDNFFALGGDSILSIQVVAAARKAGLGLRARDVFEHQTVEQLARVATRGPATDAEQGVLTGPVPLTPIQRWFLEQQPADVHHFNQALHLQARVPVEAAPLQQALTALLAHHDALRLRLAREADGWSQSLEPAGPAPAPRVVDLRGLSPPAREKRMLDEAERAQAALDPLAGRMLGAVLYQHGTPVGQSVLLVVHHLAVDAVSWPILVEDLGVALAACRAGEPIALPPKTSSFRSWAARLAEHARSPEVARDVRAWLERPWHLAAEPPHERTPVAAAAGNGDGAGPRAQRRFELDEAATHALLRERTTKDVRADELLVAALARALCTWTGSERVALDLEGHGRDAFASLDLSRTVGWFTTLYPVLLEVDRDAAPDAALASIRAQLARVPDRGRAYGVARYLSGDPQLRARLAALPAPRVAFNYLGRLGVGGERAPFALCDLPAGPMRSAHQRRVHGLEINAAVRAGRLQVELDFAADRFGPATIHRVAEEFERELRALLGVRAPAAERLSAADVADFGWTQDDLDEIYSDLGGRGTP